MGIIGRICAVAAATGLAACALGEPREAPEISLADLRLKDVSLFEQSADVVLRVRNPNDAALAVDGYRFQLTVNGQPFAKGMSGEAFTVPRLGEATTNAQATISTLDLVRQVVSAPDAQGFEYTLTGTMFLTGGIRRSVSFEQGGKLDTRSLQGR